MYIDWRTFMESFLGTGSAILVPIIIYCCQTHREKKRRRQEEKNLLGYYHFLLTSIVERVERIQANKIQYINEQAKNFVHNPPFRYPRHNEFLRLHYIDSTLFFRVWNKYIPEKDSVQTFKRTQSCLDFLEQQTEKWKSIYDEQNRRATISWQKITSGIDDINDIILSKANELEKKIKDENRTKSATWRFYKERVNAYYDLKKKRIPVEADFMELYLQPIQEYANEKYDIQLLNKIFRICGEIGFIKKQTKYTIIHLQELDNEVDIDISFIKDIIEKLKLYIKS